MTSIPLVLLGLGDVAREVAQQAQSHGPVFATTRDPERLAAIEREGFTALLADPAGDCLEGLPREADVLVSFPPDGRTDSSWAARLPAPRRLVYISSTGVYPKEAGALDDHTEAAPDTERGERRLAAEAIWRARGAVVLRAPAIYGPTRGVLQRLRAGTHRLVGDGGGRVSRIHVHDLAACVHGAFARATPGAAHVVGDLHPCTQREIVAYVCEAEGLPMPESESREQASPTLGGDRAVDPRPALSALGVELRFPSYREGLAAQLRRAST